MSEPLPLPGPALALLELDSIARGYVVADAVVKRAPVTLSLAEAVTPGKYLLLQFEHGTQLIHLGMSGSLRRVDAADEPRRHDHVDWVFADAVFRLHDPRRFGAVVWHPNEAGPLEAHPLLARLGIEPFDPRFDGDWLHRGLRGRAVAVKQALLAGDIVVGVGNIYASESLFRAGIDPRRRAGRLSRAECARLAKAIKETLRAAIRAGGSSLRDYVGADGALGEFQSRTWVYGREGEPCRRCRTPVRRIVQGARSTFFCPTCQR